jgi:hypothetical protein
MTIVKLPFRPGLRYVEHAHTLDLSGGQARTQQHRCYVFEGRAFCERNDTLYVFTTDATEVTA